MRQIRPRTVRGIQCEPATELDAGCSVHADGSNSPPVFLIFNDDGPQRHRGVIVEFDDFPERGFEGLKIKIGSRHPDPKGLPDSFHQKKTRNMVQRMVKERGVCVVNVQGPGICGTTSADDDVVGVPVPHPLRRQRHSLRPLAIGSGAQPKPGIAGGVDQPRSRGSRGDRMTADVEACLDTHNGGSPGVPLWDIHIEKDMDVRRSAWIS
jgi:hypothetical protein